MRLLLRLRDSAVESVWHPLVSAVDLEVREGAVVLADGEAGTYTSAG